MRNRCYLDNCGGFAKSHGLCEAHAWRKKAHGDNFDKSPVKRMREWPAICAAQKCANPSKSRGLCSLHYDRWLRNGDDYDQSPYTPPTHTHEEAVAEALALKDGSACWEWPLSRNPQGYGWAHQGEKTIAAHRLICILAHGEPPFESAVACHECDNPSCCNPHHLRWDTHAGNIDDRQKRGRHMHGSHHYKAKLDDDKVRSILRRLRDGEDEHALAAEYGVTHGSIWFIANGKTWKHVQAERE